MKTYAHWDIEGDYAIHRETGYDCNLHAYLGDDYTWVDHVSQKDWACSGCLAELREILGRNKFLDS